MMIEFHVTGADLRTVATCLEALTELDRAFLDRFGDRVPPLYSSGVAYQLHRGPNYFPQIPYVLEAGVADCGPLTAWRAAELRRQGQRRAVAFPIDAPPLADGRRVVHCLVSRDGTLDTLEDPSAVLGMTPIPLALMRALAMESKQWLHPVCSSWRH